MNTFRTTVAAAGFLFACWAGYDSSAYADSPIIVRNTNDDGFATEFPKGVLVKRGPSGSIAMRGTVFSTPIESVPYKLQVSVVGVRHIGNNNWVPLTDEQWQGEGYDNVAGFWIHFWPSVPAFFESPHDGEKILVWAQPSNTDWLVPVDYSEPEEHPIYNFDFDISQFDVDLVPGQQYVVAFQAYSNWGSVQVFHMCSYGGPGGHDDVSWSIFYGEPANVGHFSELGWPTHYLASKVIVKPPTPSMLGDLNGDKVVDVSDLLILLAAWGPCPRSGECPADLNGDGAVDVSDLLILLANWG